MSINHNSTNEAVCGSIFSASLAINEKPKSDLSPHQSRWRTT